MSRAAVTPSALRAVTLSLSITLMGVVCLPSRVAAQEADGQPAAPVEQRIAGTTVSFELVPVSVPAGSGTGGAAADGPGDGGAEPPTRTLWVARTETTWDAFDVFIHRLDKPDPQVPDELDALVTPSNAFVLADRGYGHNGYPLISVNHTLGQAFCEWLSAKTGRPYRLPTQAEFEAYCAAGDGSWIDSSAKGLRPFAWVRQNADRKTHEVGSKKPNPWGLHDVLGNAAEWCVDPDGTAVLRGGSFRDKAQDVGLETVAHPTPAWNATDPQIPKSRWWLADADFAGFRVVCDAVEGDGAASEPEPADDDEG